MLELSSTPTITFSNAVELKINGCCGTYADAVAYCNLIGMRLPTLDEVNDGAGMSPSAQAGISFNRSWASTDSPYPWHKEFWYTNWSIGYADVSYPQATVRCVKY